MGSRRAVHARMRRGTPPAPGSHARLRRDAHAEIRQGGVLSQERQSSAEGPSDSPEAVKAIKAWKARKA